MSFKEALLIVALVVGLALCGGAAVSALDQSTKQRQASCIEQQSKNISASARAECDELIHICRYLNANGVAWAAVGPMAVAIYNHENEKESGNGN